ncbi:unnamed protein product [Heterobilharzia americana]|nr:unnamed protein product [Heterobilharzia americana]CAH8566874.1 unnamed protein product [Heterobilharzia americana]
MSGSLLTLKNIKNWNIFSGLCVRRPAVIAPELRPFEKTVADLYEKLEFEKSHLSAHELRHAAEVKKLSNALSKGAVVSTQEALVTARETELMWESEAEKFKPADRLTENDKSGNLKSAWRVLDKPLFLLVQSSKDAPNVWSLPSAPVCNAKSLRQTADSIAVSLLPSKAKWCIFGDAPVAVWLSQDESKEDTATQVYFFNVYVDRHWHGEDLMLDDDSGVKDFAWVPRNKFKDFIKGKELLRTLKSFAVEY